MKSLTIKSLALAFLLVFLTSISFAQTKIYNEKADAKKEVAQAVAKAKKEGKHVFVKVGGNWCPWCILFHKYSQENAKVHKTLTDNYIEVLVSARENKALLKTLGNPGRFGYPVFVILNAKGEVIHIQNSGNLEGGNDYNEKKVNSFLRNWTVKAVQ
ncbi:MAG: thioredoxin family protein [Marinifilaceae bacterium]